MRLSRYSPYCAVGLHAHPFPRFVLPIATSFQTSSARADIDVNAGSALYRPSTVVHEDYYPETLSCITILCPSEYSLRHRKDLTLVQKPGIDVIAREIADELMRTQPDALAAFTLEGACNELIAIANNPEFEAPEWILWIRSVLNDCDDIRDLSLGSLAKEVGLSAPHVARVFRRRFGVSMGTYAARMRLRKAYRLLTGGDSLATVALRSGFADQSHLTRSLKAAIGKTPSAVRAARSSQGAGTEFKQEVFHLKTTHGC